MINEVNEMVDEIIKILVRFFVKIAEATPLQQKPAIPVEKSIFDDYLVCLEDGQKFKSLKRHLQTHYDLTPEQYRTKWGLPSDYPMVAPQYAMRRSILAKKIGLGTARKGQGKHQKATGGA